MLMEGQEVRVRVHPVVPLQILNLYGRDVHQKKVGTLLGYVHLHRIQVREVIPIPQINSAQFKVDIEYHKNAVAQHHKLWPKQLVLGAILTTNGLAELPTIFTQYNDKLCFTANGMLTKPLIITIDPSFPNGSFNLKAHLYSALKYNPRFPLSCFQQVPLQIGFSQEKPHQILPVLGIYKEYFGSAQYKDLIQSLRKDLPLIKQSINQMIKGQRPIDEQYLLTLSQSLRKIHTVDEDSSSISLIKGLLQASSDSLRLLEKQ